MNPTPKPPPSGWPRISSAVYYRDPGAMIDWLCKAFGFAVRLRIDADDGTVAHSELTLGDDGLIMVGTERKQALRFETAMLSPLTAGGNTQALLLHVDDADAHCEQARAAGARIVDEPKVHDYGEGYWADRSYGCIDLEGHLWWVSQRLRG